MIDVGNFVLGDDDPVPDNKKNSCETCDQKNFF
jgi:hypothetical protein